jgi:uracil-DNA glycosylase
MTAAEFVPQSRSLGVLREAAAECRGCDLYRHATQTVFGEGHAGAPFIFVGEQPGDSEDLDGRPFVGPAGKLLRAAMQEAGIDEKDVYITNAVKHFKFIERGKQRIHQSPKRFEIVACSPWLDAEILAVKPVMVVALGATAAQSLMGTSFRLTQHRGELLSSPRAPHLMVTVHPSSILRAADEVARHAQRKAFVEDLKKITARLDELRSAAR